MRTHYDAVIIGAGPAGSSAAILLAQAGWSVAVLEKKRFPRRKVCGECVAASNLPLLDALGIGPAFDAAAGPPLRQVGLMSGAQNIHADLPPLADGRHPWGRALGRDVFDSLLLERARQAGATILQPWAAFAIRGHPGAFQCDAAALESQAVSVLTATVLIAAHGSWTPPPDAGSVPRWPRLASDLFAFKANFKEAEIAHGLLSVLAFAGAYGGMVMAGGGITTLACCIRRDRLRSCRELMQGQSAGSAVEAYMKENCAAVARALAEARRQGEWLSAGPIRPGVRVQPRGSGVFLIGNAAGEAHPIIGEGISMALQSSWLLCEMLFRYASPVLAGAAQPQIQREYAHAWRGSFTPRIRWAALFAHAAMRPALAPMLLPVLRWKPTLMTCAARLSGKVRPAPAHSIITNRPGRSI
ncbi:MAG: NAD(P)/FAD-dependent oxidoreductase [Pseudomonadota bacterium]